MFVLTHLCRQSTFEYSCTSREAQSCYCQVVIESKLMLLQRDYKNKAKANRFVFDMEKCRSIIGSQKKRRFASGRYSARRRPIEADPVGSARDGLIRAGLSRGTFHWASSPNIFPIQVNVIGTLILFQAAYPLLKANTSSPKFIPISLLPSVSLMGQLPLLAW